MTCRSALPWLLLIATGTARADGPRDNQAENVRPVPPKGIKVADADRAAIQSGLDDLGRRIDALRTSLRGRPGLLRLLPDVQVYHKAVHEALVHDEFFQPREIATAKDLLKRGIERAEQLQSGKAPWDSATGLVVLGYISKIDGSIQPYGLVVPESYRPDTPHRFRLDVWCHGRGETLSELNFLRDRQSNPGKFAPRDAFVVHPYGRYCNANKFAGEIDLFEALEDIKRHYPIDEDRVVMRGFSMGGAACWQFAVHYPGLWAAAAPGAGFAETPEFLKVFQKETLQPTWYEQKLWHLYDSTDYALNLFNLPTVAYSGDRDSQKQAADVMARALKDEGIELVHVIGKNIGHDYTPEAKVEINRRIDSIVEQGRNLVPRSVRFTTWTLRYNRAYWVQVDGMEHHWERATVRGRAIARRPEALVRVATQNVSALTLEIPAGRCTFDPAMDVQVEIDRVVLDAPRVLSDRSWTGHFRKVGGKWTSVASADDGTLRKRHGLQGPIDDAFMDSFLMVRPTGTPLNEKVGKWATAEMGHAVDHWRRQFRGDARVKDDRDVTDADIAAHNLVLWGDPSSNARPGEDRGQAADRLGPERGSSGRQDLRRRASRARDDLSQPAQSEAVCGAQ